MRKIRQFEVQTDDGRRFTIYEYQDDVPADDLDSPYDTLPDLPELRTSNGLHAG